LAPENTLLSFEKAIGLGVDMVELDVHFKNGKLFVIHNIEDLKKDTPILENVLDLVNKRAIVNIELKGDNTAEPTASLIEKYLNKNWQNNDFMVSSFKPKELNDFKKINPQIRLGFIVDNKKIDIVKTAQEIGVFCVNVSKKIVDKELIDSLHKQGFKVFVWTVNKKRAINKTALLGADGIFTDYPNKFFQN